MNDYTVMIAKKEIAKTIINIMYANEKIDFRQYNNILKKLDEDIGQLTNKNNDNLKRENIIVNVPL